MTDIDYASIISVVNFVALVAFLLLLGAIVFSMARRIRLYRVARTPLPVILKRGFVWFGTLAFLSSEVVVLRVAGGDVLAEPSALRLAFLVQFDAIFLGALLYYAKVELTDVDDPDEQ